MATEGHSTNCLDDPNFATICSFLEKFGELCHLVPIPFAQLQEMLENTNEVPAPLVQLHIRLLRRVFKSINTGKWEKSVSKFAHMYNSQDGWEVERFGYKKSKMQTKLRILKNLLESQFDYNVKFKGEVNKLLASDLRMVPLGRDQEGHSYWYQVDAEANLRVYREDIDEETWEIVASSRDEMEQLITQLKNGEIRKGKSLEDNVMEEDINGLESMDIEPKEILLDTGKPCDLDDAMDADSSDDHLEIAEGLPDVHDDSFDEEMPDEEEVSLSLQNTESAAPPLVCNGHDTTLPDKNTVDNALTINSSTVISDSVVEPDVNNKSNEISECVTVTSTDVPVDQNSANDQQSESKISVQSEVSEEASNLSQIPLEHQKNSENVSGEAKTSQPSSSGSSNNLSNLQKLNAMMEMFSSNLPTKPNEEIKMDVEGTRLSRVTAPVGDKSPYFTSKTNVETDIVQDLSGAPSAPPRKTESTSTKTRTVSFAPAEQTLSATSKMSVPKEENLSKACADSVSPYFLQNTVPGTDNAKLSINQIVAELGREKSEKLRQKLKPPANMSAANAIPMSRVSTYKEPKVGQKELTKKLNPSEKVEPDAPSVKSETSSAKPITLRGFDLGSETAISSDNVVSTKTTSDTSKSDELSAGKDKRKRVEYTQISVDVPLAKERSPGMQVERSIPENLTETPAAMQIVTKISDDNQGDHKPKRSQHKILTVGTTFKEPGSEMESMCSTHTKIIEDMERSDVRNAMDWSTTQSKDPSLSSLDVPQHEDVCMPKITAPSSSGTQATNSDIPPKLTEYPYVKEYFSKCEQIQGGIVTTDGKNSGDQFQKGGDSPTPPRSESDQLISKTSAICADVDELNKKSVDVVITKRFRAKLEDFPAVPKELPAKSGEILGKLDELPERLEEFSVTSEERSTMSEDFLAKPFQSSARTDVFESRFEELPVISEDRPSKSDDQPSKSDDQPSKSDDRHSKSDDQPSKSDDRHSKSDDRHSKSDDRHSKSDDRHSKSDDQPLKSENQPLKSEDRSLESKVQSLKSKVQSLKSEDQSLKSKVQSWKSEDQSLKSKVQSWKSEDQSLKSGDQSLKSEDQSLKSGNQSLKSEDQSLKSGNQPLKSEERPKVLEDCRTKLEEIPAKLEEITLNREDQAENISESSELTMNLSTKPLKPKSPINPAECSSEPKFTTKLSERDVDVADGPPKHKKSSTECEEITTEPSENNSKSEEHAINSSLSIVEPEHRKGTTEICSELEELPVKDLKKCIVTADLPPKHITSNTELQKLSEKTSECLTETKDIVSKCAGSCKIATSVSKIDIDSSTEQFTADVGLKHEIISIKNTAPKMTVVETLERLETPVSTALDSTPMEICPESENLRVLNSDLQVAQPIKIQQTQPEDLSENNVTPVSLVGISISAESATSEIAIQNSKDPISTDVQPAPPALQTDSRLSDLDDITNAPAPEPITPDTTVSHGIVSYQAQISKSYVNPDKVTPYSSEDCSSSEFTADKESSPKVPNAGNDDSDVNVVTKVLEDHSSSGETSQTSESKLMDFKTSVGELVSSRESVATIVETTAKHVPSNFAEVESESAGAGTTTMEVTEMTCLDATEICPLKVPSQPSNSPSKINEEETKHSSSIVASEPIVLASCPPSANVHTEIIGSLTQSVADATIIKPSETEPEVQHVGSELGKIVSRTNLKQEMHKEDIHNKLGMANDLTTLKDTTVSQELPQSVTLEEEVGRSDGGFSANTSENLTSWPAADEPTLIYKIGRTSETDPSDTLVVKSIVSPSSGHCNPVPLDPAPEGILSSTITTQEKVDSSEDLEQKVELLEIVPVKQEIHSVVANEADTYTTTSLTDVRKEFVKLEPESVKQEPEPESIIKELTPINPVPDSVIQEVKPKSESTKQEPESVKLKLETIIKRPRSVNLEPESSVQEPESENPEPESFMQEPESANPDPESFMREQESVNPATLKQEPETGKPETEKPEPIIKGTRFANPDPQSITQTESLKQEPEFVKTESLKPVPEPIIAEPEIVNPVVDSVILEPESVKPELKSIQQDLDSNCIKQDSESESIKRHPESKSLQQETESESIQQDPESECIQQDPESESIQQDPESESIQQDPESEPMQQDPESESMEQDPESESMHQDPESESIKRHPESKSMQQDPETESIQQEPEPESIQQEPESESIKRHPESKSIQQDPETESIQQEPEPESIQQEPESESIKRHPESKFIQQDPESESIKRHPESKSIQQDPESESVKRNPESKSVKRSPESECNKQESESVKHELESVKHDSESIKSEPESVKNDSESIKSEPESVKHDSESVKHESGPIKPESESVKHESGPIKPESESVKSSPEPIKKPESVNPYHECFKQPEFVKPETEGLTQESESGKPELKFIAQEPESGKPELKFITQELESGKPELKFITQEPESVKPEPKFPQLEPDSVNLQSESTPKIDKSIKPALGLVAYGSSSEDEDDENDRVKVKSIPTKESQVMEDSCSGHKRKLEEPDASEQEAKMPKIMENPIVGEAIEEDLMVITGSGEGAQNEGGNESPSDSPLPPDLEEDLEMEHEQNSQDGLLPPKPKGRGRPRKNPPKEVLKDKNVREKSTTEGKTSRRSSFNNDDMNGLNASGPVRRSGRVAQIRQKEEEERRKLEEERLAQLKEAQVRKQQKQLEKELKATKQGGIKPKEPKLAKKPKVGKSQKHESYIPSPSETGSDSDNEPEEEYVDPSEKPGRKKRKKRSKNGKPIKRGGNPWMHSSSEEDEAVEEEEDDHVEEEEEEELIFNGSDHEFSPESDIGEESEYSPSRHARTAKQKEEAVDKYAETYCDKCGKGDHPEWILLCDSCDKGWHALCVNPQIWVIPEGEWFCPPCQHNMLVSKLSENLVEYEKLLKKRENEVLRKQRLAYVGISLNNVLPSAEKPANEKSDNENVEEEKKTKKSSRRRRLYSDEEDIEDFINDNEDGDDDSGSGSGSYESEEEPIYQLRARRATKGFSFQEYDDMIKSALRGDSPDEDEKEKLDEKPLENSNNGILTEAKEEDKDSNKVERTNNEDEEEDDDEKIGVVKKQKKPTIKDEDTDEDELDEKEKNRRKMLNQSQKKNRRRLNDLDATSEEDSDEDFKGSGIDDDDDDEENVVEEDSDWSEDGDESDDSIAMAKLAARKRKRHGPLGRQERYSDIGTVRRSTRRRKSRITYDESDQDEDEEDQTEKWQSGESENSESESESEDETWGKKKKKKVQSAGKSKLASFFLQGPGSFKKSKPKKKRRRTDEDDVDRAWSNKFGNKGRKSDEPVERKTRGRQINFKDILDSGESDDDGNIRPKRRRILSDSDEDSEEPSSSRKLAEEIRAANAKQMAEEKLQHEEKLKAIANAGKHSKTIVSAATTTVPIPLILPAPMITPVTVSTPVSSTELLPPLNSVEITKDRPIKITNSIVESILLRKSPDIPDSPPSPLPLTISSPNDPIMTVPPLSGLTPAPYLPSVISSMTLGAGSSTGSARVGKKKTASMLPTPASSSDVLPFPSKKLNAILSSTPLPPKPVAPGITTTPSGNSNISSVLPPNLATDLTRIAGPMYGNNPALRPFHPAWGRNPPPYSGPPPPAGLGKPPPLNSSSFMAQSGQLRPPPSSAYTQQPPPGLRIPNPNALQAFQQFSKRTGEVGTPSYRLPPSHQLPSLPSMARERDRIFLGGSSPYASYGILPPQGQGQQHAALFAPPFEYRAPDTFKEELLERAGGQPPPSASSTSAAVPVVPVTVSGPKEEGNSGSQGDGEFGGLVSYFSSQHSNDED